MDYQVGGSIVSTSPSYISRNADLEIDQALKKGEFCYVLNARQMGKSSLLIKTRQKLETEGYKCASLDMTQIGSENITPQQWYKGIVTDIWRNFNLLRVVKLKQWWQENQELSLLQRLSYFLLDIVLVQFPQDKIIIFVDEIDSILTLPFAVDDFFAWIRFCYNQRGVDSRYSRLTFAIFGVATPADLIHDPQRTPFNIGTSIDLHGFSLDEALPLAQGFPVSPPLANILLAEILTWTGGQPFLTQKLCQLVVRLGDPFIQEQVLDKATAQQAIETLVQQYIIGHWESQDEPEHLRTIRDRLLQKTPNLSRRLGLYQQIVQKQIVPLQDNREQTELLLSGVVVKHQSQLQVKNPIYAQIFNLPWVTEKLAELRPYSQTLSAWIESQKQDESRLLRGKALQEAKTWAQGKSLTDQDYQFLAQSEDCDRAAVQQALEAEKLKAVEAKLHQERKAARLQKLVLSTLSLAFLLSLLLGGATYSQYRQAQKNERAARLREIEALTSSAQGLFASHQPLNALLQALKAQQNIQQLGLSTPPLVQEAQLALNRAVHSASEYNQLSIHKTRIWDIEWSRDGEKILTVAQDGLIGLWNEQGQLLHTIIDKSQNWRALALSPNHQIIVTGSGAGQVKLWTNTGQFLQQFSAHSGQIWEIIFSPDGQTFATASSDGTVKLWTRQGNLVTTLTGHQDQVRQVAFSPDGQTLATASNDETVKLWRRDGTLLKTFDHFQANVISVAFSPNGQKLVAGGNDARVMYWDIAGTAPPQQLGQHEASILNVAISPDGLSIASGSWDQTLRLWSPDGQHLRTLRGHKAAIARVHFSADGTKLSSGAYNGEIKLWRLSHPFLTELQGHESEVRALAFTPDNTLLASSSWKGKIQLWDKGEHQTTLDQHTGAVTGLDFSPDGNILATGSWDHSIRFYQRNGQELKVIANAHIIGVGEVAWSPDGELLASTGNDQTVKLWSKEGELLRTITDYQDGITTIAWSPDGQTFVTGSEDQQVILRNRQGHKIKTFFGHTAPIWGVAFSPDGQTIASGSPDGTVILWSLTGKPSQTLTGHQGIVEKVAFSPDGQYLASASWDGTVKLWTSDGQEIKTLARHNGPVRIVRFSPDSQKLLSGGDDQTVIIWDLQEILNLDEFTYGCQLVQDYLKTHSKLRQGSLSLCQAE